LWLWTALLCGFVLFPLFDPRANPLIPFAALALGVVLYTWFHPGLRQQAEEPPAPVQAPEESAGTGPGFGA